MQSDLSPKAARPETTEQRRTMYSTAAVAAGVSLLALTPPAEAKVVITTHINIPINGNVLIDLNHDGIADLSFVRDAYPALGAFFTYISARALHGGGVVQQTPTGFASIFLRSAKIGPSDHFAPYGLLARRGGEAYSPVSTSGLWGGGQPNRFLGVKFLIKGTTHYGWVRITVKNSKNVSIPLTGTITEYGYETIANKAVLAGLPSNAISTTEESAGIGKAPGASLGMLALGADGLAAWRRQEGDSDVGPYRN